MTAPLWINAFNGEPDYDANSLRQAHALPFIYDGRPLGARQGVRPGGSQLEVSLDENTITVAPGVALIDPGLTAKQGPYWVVISDAEQHQLATPDPSNPRVDIVVLRVYDHDEDASGQRKGVTEYITGTPDPTPSAPATPSGALLLAEISVPKEGSGEPTVTDRRVFTSTTGGTLLVRSQTERDSLDPYPGMRVYRLDTPQREEVYDGVTWRAIGTVPVANGTERDTLDTYPGLRVYRLDLKREEIFDGTTWLPLYATNSPGIVVGRDSTQTIPNSTETKVIWTTVDVEDPTGTFSFEPPATDVVIPVSGVYLITTSVRWASGNGLRRVSIYTYESSFLVADNAFAAPSSTEAAVNVAHVGWLAAGTVVDVRVRHLHGSDLNLSVTTRTPNLSVWRVA